MSTRSTSRRVPSVSCSRRSRACWCVRRSIASGPASAASCSVPSFERAASGPCRSSSAGGRRRATCRRWPRARSRSAGLSSKAEFLARIRGEMAKTRGLFPASPAERPAEPRQRLELLRRELSERWPQTLARFRAEFERVAGVFHRVPSAADVPGELERICRERAAHRLVAWPAEDLRVALAPALGAAGITVESMPRALPPDAERRRLRALIAEADLGVTGADIAIAETGPPVLVSAAGRPRSTSLLPPCHVAVFDRTVLVESLEQLGLVLEAWHDGPAPPERGAVINFITGPSRTADIELTLTRGVHGPKEIHAIFVDGGLGLHG